MYSSLMGQSFTKLFSSITDSTIWGEPDHIRLVWITLLASADAKGRVYSSVPGLAVKSRVDLPLVVEALDRLAAPDQWSRTKVSEGRRIEPIDGGWRLINYLKYRELKDSENIKAAKRDWWNKNRGLESKLEKLEPTRSHSTQEEEEEEEEKKKRTRSPSAPHTKAAIGEELENFNTHIWKPYPKRTSQTGTPIGKGHKPDALARCLAVKQKWGIGWSELNGAVLRYQKHPNVKNGHVQAVEVFFGDKGHWLECWEWVKGQRPLAQLEDLA